MNLLRRTIDASFFLFMLCSFNSLNAQVCATPGLDGTINSSGIVNTYFSTPQNTTLLPGSKTLNLNALSPIDESGNSYGTTPIKPGDLLLIIQSQDATINYTNDAFYGANNSTLGPDFLGGTGFTSLGNTGKFEYVISTNSVPLTGGVLKFKAFGVAGGIKNTYINAPPTLAQGKRTFQVIRVPQYANLVLQEDIRAAPFNGEVGGVIAFEVGGILNFNGFKIDASMTGFRGGVFTTTGHQMSRSTYATNSPPNGTSAGKGEGIAGTPRIVSDTYGEKINYKDDYPHQDGLPGGSASKGAPGNAGGGANDLVSGGGGGGNGGAGGAGSHGYSELNALDRIYPNGGRPGIQVYDSSNPDSSRLIMGGGGGGGSDRKDGFVKIRNSGGVGGGIILINVNYIRGKGVLLSNGNNVPADTSAIRNSYYLGRGTGGGGAGGTIFLRVKHPDPSMLLILKAKGGNGGIMKYPPLTPMRGPGGGGGGGQVFCIMPSALLDIDVSKGKAGEILNDKHPDFIAQDGQDGNIVHYPFDNLSTCFPELSTRISVLNPGKNYYPGSQLTYQIKTTNTADAGNAGGVQTDIRLPIGITYVSSNISYSGNAGGPSDLTNTGTDPNHLRFGDFNISPGDTVTITVVAKVDCSTLPGIYHSSAEATYLDPTRTINDPNRRITPLLKAFTGIHTTYETGGSVPGTNYNGTLNSATTDDVKVTNLSLSNNVIHAPSPSVFCINGDPDKIIGELPEGGTQVFSYQWQQSTDNTHFENIPGAVSQGYDPLSLTHSVYYRRLVSHLDCPQSEISNIIFINVQNPLPTIDFILPDLCLNDGLAIFKNQTTISDATEDRLTYSWDFGDAANSTPFNPNTSTIKDGSHTYTQTGNYIISLTVRKNGECPLTVQKSFRVNGSIPKAIFSVQNTNVCSGQEVIFEDKATVNFGEITKIEWYYDYGNTASVVEIDGQPQNRLSEPRKYRHSYPLFRSPATKTAVVRMVVYSGISCVDEQQMSLNLQAVPEVDFGPIAPVCEESPAIRFTQGKEIWGIVAGTGRYSGPGIDAQGLFNPRVAGPGTHQISYLFLADNGCPSLPKIQAITVYPAPTVNAGTDGAILEGGQMQLDAKTTGLSLRYKWTPATSLDRDDIANPIASPTKDMTYKVTVTTDQGCSASDDIFVQVLKNPEIPNAFTPNGDNINDDWNIKYLSSYPKATVNVYNRYGEKVFSSQNSRINNWDGKYRGIDVPVGTYYYVIDPKNGKKIMTGALTILR